MLLVALTFEISHELVSIWSRASNLLVVKLKAIRACFYLWMGYLTHPHSCLDLERIVLYK